MKTIEITNGERKIVKDALKFYLKTACGFLPKEEKQVKAVLSKVTHGK